MIAWDGILRGLTRKAMRSPSFYDNADRLTQSTYPDRTSEQITYDRLDAVLSKDRIGRWTQRAYDSLDQLILEVDPLGRKTQYTWCSSGALEGLTDPAGHLTTWRSALRRKSMPTRPL